MKPTRKIYECAAELIEKQKRLALGQWREIDLVTNGMTGCCCIGGAVMACSTNIYNNYNPETEEVTMPLFAAPLPEAAKKWGKFTEWNDNTATPAEAAQFLRDIAKTLPEE